MNRLKSSLTCSKCLKLFKNPIELPCNHSVCNEHLSENNIIKCDKCNKDFQVKDNDFKSTDLFLNKLISEQLYLNDEEMSLKIKIEESIKAFFIVMIVVRKIGARAKVPTPKLKRRRHC